MANPTSTTFPRVQKAPPAGASALALQFLELIHAWGRHVTSEKSLACTAVTDPYHEARLASAEIALPLFHEALLATLEVPPQVASDGPLRRMALLAATLVRENRASAFDRYLALHDEFALFFAVEGCGPAADNVRQLLAGADRRIRVMARLPLYRAEGVAQDALPELIAA